jgi:hypothetical protein
MTCKELFDPIVSVDNSKAYHICQLPKGHDGVHDASVEETWKDKLSWIWYSIRGSCF